MLLETALDRIAAFAGATPRWHVEGFLRRIRSGQAVEMALIAESVRPSESSDLMELARVSVFRDNVRLLGELIEAEYKRRANETQAPALVWTGPRPDAAIKFSRTSVAVRKIVDEARIRILIAGYHISSETLGIMGLWSAIDRGVVVEMLLDQNDSKATDKDVFAAKGISVHSIATVFGGYSKFHVKAIVADGVRAIVGSANFTKLGHTENIELGVLIEGQPAATVEALLRSYLQVAPSAGWAVS